MKAVHLYLHGYVQETKGKPPGNIFCYSVLLECNMCIWFTIKSFNFTRGILFGSGEWSWWIRPGSPNFLLCIPQCVKSTFKKLYTCRTILMFAVKHMAYYEMIKYMIHLLSQMWVLPKHISWRYPLNILQRYVSLS